MTKKMKCIKPYQICGFKIQKDSILEQIESDKPGQSIFRDEEGNKFYFDNSEIVFSPLFSESFVGVE